MESIHRILEKYETDLNALKDKEVTLYGFVQEKVANVYDELKDIDKHSIIELNGKREKMFTAGFKWLTPGISADSEYGFLDYKFATAAMISPALTICPSFL